MSVGCESQGVVVALELFVELVESAFTPGEVEAAVLAEDAHGSDLGRCDVLGSVLTDEGRENGNKDRKGKGGEDELGN